MTIWTNRYSGDMEEKTDLRMLTRQMLRMRKWTIQDLADHMGASRQVIANWLNGSCGLGYERVERLLWLIGVRY